MLFSCKTINTKSTLTFLFSKRSLIYWFGLLTIILSRIFAKYPYLTNSLYSNGLYPVISTTLSTYTSWFPFSLSDLFYTTLIVYFLVALFLVITLKKKRKIIISITAKLIIVIYISFYWLWGFNYFRSNIYSRITLSEKVHTNDLFTYTLDQLIIATNQQREKFDFSNNQNIDSIIEATYKNEAEFLGIHYPMGKRRIKSFLYAKYMSAASIGGYIGPFFNEVHTNPLLLSLQMPAVIAHEKAHQFGIASESEANFYAWYICIKSGNNDLSYSANLYMLRHFLGYAKQNCPDTDFNSKISEKVYEDMIQIREHWKALHINSVDVISSFIYDKYLRFNHVDQGINDYGGAVQLIIDYGYFNGLNYN